MEEYKLNTLSAASGDDVTTSSSVPRDPTFQTGEDRLSALIDNCTLASTTKRLHVLHEYQALSPQHVSALIMCACIAVCTCYSSHLRIARFDEQGILRVLRKFFHLLLMLSQVTNIVEALLTKICHLLWIHRYQQWIPTHTTLHQDDVPTSCQFLLNHTRQVFGSPGSDKSNSGLARYAQEFPLKGSLTSSVTTLEPQFFRHLFQHLGMNLPALRTPMLARKTSGGFKQGSVTRHEPVEQNSNGLPPTRGLVNDGGKHSIALYTFTAMEKYIGSRKKVTWQV